MLGRESRAVPHFQPNAGLLECVREGDGSVMELADMQVLEACARKGVRVQVPPEPLPRTTPAHDGGRSSASHQIAKYTDATTTAISTITHQRGGP